MRISYEKLFALMREKGLKKTELTSLAKISTNQMAHLSKGDSVQVSVLYKVCQALGCQLDEIIEFKF